MCCGRRLPRLRRSVCDASGRRGFPRLSSEITRDVETERAKRLQPVVIPAGVKAPKKAWGVSESETPFPALPANASQFPRLPEKQLNGKPVVIGGKKRVPAKTSMKSLGSLGSLGSMGSLGGKKEVSNTVPNTVSNTVPNTVPSPAVNTAVNATPKIATKTSSLENGRFYTPPLAPATSAVTLPWGRTEDRVERAIEKALRESEEQKKKGKGRKGVKIVFWSVCWHRE